MDGWPFGVFPPDGLEGLGPHTTAYYAAGYPYSNSAIVAGSDAVLVFDANIFYYAADLKSILDRHWPGVPAYLVISHTHSDHVDGAMYFSPPAQTLSSKFTQGRLGWWSGQDQTARNAEYNDSDPNAVAWYRDFRMVVPARSVAGPEAVRLGGGVQVELVPEQVAHTPGDLWALVEPDGMALCGDLWFNDCEPYLGSGSIDGSLAALDHLRASGARVHLPRHGRAGLLPPDHPRDRYCRWVKEQVATAMAGDLAGEKLWRAVRSTYDAQVNQPGALRFALSGKRWLEDAVEAAEAEARGEPLYRNLAVVDVNPGAKPHPESPSVYRLSILLAPSTYLYMCVRIRPFWHDGAIAAEGPGVAVHRRMPTPILSRLAFARSAGLLSTPMRPVGRPPGDPEIHYAWIKRS